MSVARGNGQNGGHFYSNVTQPVKIFSNFVVDSTNGNGLGIRSLKSNGYVRNVFMHTAATPGSNDGFLNPNPQAGTILVQLNNNYNYYVGGKAGFVSPVSGTPILVTTGTTVGLVYVIVSVGTTTVDQWVKLGLPPGITPAVGVSFVAKATTTATGTGVIEVPATAGSGITNVEVQGNSRLSGSSSIAQYGGMWIISNCYASGVLTAPADGSTCSMSFEFDASSVTIDGI